MEDDDVDPDGTRLPRCYLFTLENTEHIKEFRSFAIMNVEAKHFMRIDGTSTERKQRNISKNTFLYLKITQT